MLGKLFAVPGMKIAGGAIALLGVLLLVQTLRLSWAHTEIADMKREAAEIAAKAVTQARNADGAAQTTVSQDRASTAASEAKAREAAEKSDDALKAGLDSLRNER